MWKKRGAEWYLYFAEDGRWTFGDAEQKNALQSSPYWSSRGSVTAATNSWSAEVMVLGSLPMDVGKWDGHVSTMKTTLHVRLTMPSMHNRFCAHPLHTVCSAHHGQHSIA